MSDIQTEDRVSDATVDPSCLSLPERLRRIVESGNSPAVINIAREKFYSKVYKCGVPPENTNKS